MSNSVASPQRYIWRSWDILNVSSRTSVCETLWRHQSWSKCHKPNKQKQYSFFLFPWFYLHWWKLREVFCLDSCRHECIWLRHFCSYKLAACVLGGDRQWMILLFPELMNNRHFERQLGTASNCTLSSSETNSAYSSACKRRLLLLAVPTLIPQSRMFVSCPRSLMTTEKQ